jgi:micrococcal nuclease
MVRRWVLSGLLLLGCDEQPTAAPPPPILSQAPTERTESRTESAAPTKEPETPTESAAPRKKAKAPPSQPDVPAVEASLVKVTDGDTIVVRLNGKRERVRLIGIDTPETRHSPRGPEPLADEATAALRRLLANANILLRFDAEERDRYGRLLAYVYTHDGEFVNAAMLREGWARPLRIPPNVRHAKAFERIAADARRRDAGIWAIER